ncbi:Gamma-secretase subunit Aph-1 [Gryllus bimaculatus]|nr:Gamma-secretase subunit Aph-1 [Gryllus bimaculatus]
MTLLEFVGCMLVSFSPFFAMFAVTIASDPIRIIILFSSAFFWYFSLLLPCLLWLLAPGEVRWVLGLVTAVLLQELFRIVLYKFLRRIVTLRKRRRMVSYVSGLGFGAISGAFAMLNLLADAAGPGTVGIHDASELYVLYSSAVTCCMILLHVFWSVIAFASLDHGNYFGIFWVVGSHMFVSLLTLAMEKTDNERSLYLIFIVTAATGVLTFITMGGTLRRLTDSFCTCDRDIHSS